MTEHDLLLLADVVKTTRLSVSTIRRLRRRNQFPEGFQLGERRIAWRRADVERWLNSRADEALARGARREVA